MTGKNTLVLEEDLLRKLKFSDNQEYHIKSIFDNIPEYGADIHAFLQKPDIDDDFTLCVFAILIPIDGKKLRIRCPGNIEFVIIDVKAASEWLNDAIETGLLEALGSLA